MLKRFSQRLLFSLLTFWGVLTLVFFLIHLAPGDPVSIYISPHMKPEILQNIRHQYGLDLSISQQYFKWILNIISGNFGYSFLYKKPVLEVLIPSLINTLYLTLPVFFLQFFFGLLFGLAVGYNIQSTTSKILKSGFLIIYSVPVFFIGLFFTVIFSYHLGWFPSGQLGSIGIEGNFWTISLDRLRHLVLPLLTLLIPLSAYTAKFISGRISEILSQDYIRTLRSFGLSSEKILYKYVLKSSLLSLVTLLGIFIPFIVSGTIVTEYIFSWPGMGKLAVAAVYAHDYPVILAATVLSTFAVIIGNILADFSYGFIDPLIRKSLNNN